MKQLNKLQSIIFAAGGVMMVVGGGCFAFLFLQKIACWVFLAGAVMFAIMQALQTYEGNSTTIRRLKNIQGLAGLFFILGGISMVDTAFNFLMSLFNNFMDYYTYIYNKWVALILVAALIELYTTHRIAAELKKETAAGDGKD